jgi:Fe-S cluster assembly iron-binding protein IscA
MLALTEGAAEVIKQLTAAPAAEGVRISAASSNGPHAALQIELATGPQEEDAVLEAGGAQLFLEPHALALLDDKVLDAGVEGDEVQFAVLEQPADDEDEPAV